MKEGRAIPQQIFQQFKSLSLPFCLSMSDDQVAFVEYIAFLQESGQKKLAEELITKKREEKSRFFFALSAYINFPEGHGFKDFLILSYCTKNLESTDKKRQVKVISFLEHNTRYRVLLLQQKDSSAVDIMPILNCIDREIKRQKETGEYWLYFFRLYPNQKESVKRLEKFRNEYLRQGLLLGNQGAIQEMEKFIKKQEWSDDDKKPYFDLMANVRNRSSLKK